MGQTCQVAHLLLFAPVVCQPGRLPVIHKLVTLLMSMFLRVLYTLSPPRCFLSLLVLEKQLFQTNTHSRRVLVFTVQNLFRVVQETSFSGEGLELFWNIDELSD